MARDPEVTKVFRKLANARREVIKAIERAAEAHDQVGLRRGHLTEMRRRLIAIRDEADRAVRAFSDDQ